MINHPKFDWGHHDTPSHEEGGTLVHPIWYTSNVGKTIPPINMVIWGMVYKVYGIVLPTWSHIIGNGIISENLQPVFFSPSHVIGINE